MGNVTSGEGALLRREVADFLDLVQTADPDFVKNTREDLVGFAAAAKARKDPVARLELERRARATEWQMTRRWPAEKRGRNRRDDRPLLSADSRENTVYWQHVYAVGDAPLDRILEADDVDELVQRAFRGRDKDTHVTRNSGEQEWYTPRSIIDAARDVLGGIDLDPASNAGADRVVQAERYFSADDDGLAQEWHGRVWMNPPYSAGLIDKFVYKLLDELDAGHISAAVVLTNNATDTVWWQMMARRSIVTCFHAGRVRFITPDGADDRAGLQGQTIAGLDVDTDKFRDAFDAFGVVM